MEICNQRLIIKFRDGIDKSTIRKLRKYIQENYPGKNSRNAKSAASVSHLFSYYRKDLKVLDKLLGSIKTEISWLNR